MARPLCTSFDEDILDQLQAIADDDFDGKPSTVVREAVDVYLEALREPAPPRRRGFWASLFNLG